MTTVNSKMNVILNRLSTRKYTISTLQELLTLMNEDKVRSNVTRNKKKRRNLRDRNTDKTT